MKTLNFLWLWLLLLLCLTHGFEAKSFHNRRYQNFGRISRSTATIHQRQMRSLTHTARCRRYILYFVSSVFQFLSSPIMQRYIYSSECRGIMSKRSQTSDPEIGLGKRQQVLHGTLPRNLL